MANEDAATTSGTKMGMGARIGWCVLVAVTLAVCYFSNLGVIGFVGPDEPRYAWIARDMAESGDWIAPRLYGRPWFEKPVLYYWMAGASFKLFGVSEAAARLPSALCALFATLALAWLAWRVYGAETARWLLLLLPTSVGMIGFSHAAATDMPFSAMLTIAMVFAAVVLRLTRNENTPILPHTPWPALLLFGFFLGLAVLAKGPAAIILCGGAVFFWALLTKKWRDAFRLLHPIVIASFCATALPWYILCSRRNPDFFRVFIIEHNFKRYLTPEFQHIQPFWYYVPVVLIAFLPWSAALLWSTVQGSRRVNAGRVLSPRTVFFLTWVLFCLAFFSASKSKLPGYVLPSLPAIALLLSRTIAASASKKALGFTVGIFGTILLLALFPLSLALHELSRFRPDIVTSYEAILLGIALVNLAMAVAFLFRLEPKTSQAIQFAAGGFALLPSLFAPLILPHSFLNDPSTRNLAQELRTHAIPGEKLVIRHMTRDYLYGLSFYMHRELQNWDGTTVNGETYVLSGLNRPCADYVPAGNDCSTIVLGPNAKGWFIWVVKPHSADGAPGRRQMH